MKVLLINPGNTRAIYQTLSTSFSAIEPPSLAALFASYLKNKGISVKICDVAGGDHLLHYLHDKPDIAVLVVYGFQPSASTQNMDSALSIATAIKEFSPLISTVFTGTHPSALPKETVQNVQVDYVIEGEGPQAIYALAKGVLSKDIPGLHTKTHSNLPGPLIEDLDKEMPHASWGLLPMPRYRAHNWHAFGKISRKPYASIHTSMGCPFKCSFCCINAPFGKPTYRMWSPETIGREIDVLHKKYGVSNIKFVDEMFVLNKEHVLGICRELKRRNYDLNIWAYARVDTIRDEFLEELKAAGFRWLALGIESGSKHVRDGVDKGRFGWDDILKTVRKVQSAGINVIGNYIFGLPDDTIETMQETLNLAIEANCEFANFYSAMAYPGSKLFKDANPSVLPDKWIGYSQHSYECQPLPTESLSAAQVLRFRDSAFEQYFTNPKYLFMIRDKFGVGALHDIESMNQIKLKRKLLG